jgi:DNA-binding IclR family transcriptional regulator
MAGNSVDSGRSVTSKVIAILMTFSGGSEYTLTEIARLTGLPISTAHRLATELATAGLLERTDDGQYRVGMRLKAIAGQAVPVSASVYERTRRVLEDLAAAATRSTVRLGVLDGLHVAYIEKTSDNRPVSMVFEPTVLPAHATAMGKALLAFAPMRVVEELIGHGLPRYTQHTVTVPQLLRRALSFTRLSGVAVWGRELDPHTSAIAVPVFGAGGGVVAALEVAVQDSQDLRLIQPPLVVAARSLSRELQASHVRGRIAISPDRHFDVMINSAVAAMRGSASQQR